MNIEMPDVLGKVDRTQGVVASIDAASSMPSIAPTDVSALGTTRKRVGESFGQVLNRSLVKKGEDGGTSTDTAKSFAELLNGRKGVTQEDESDLNHRHKATAKNATAGAAATDAAAGVATKRTAPGMMGPGQRFGET